MNSANLIVNGNKCLKELGLLMANHKCRLDAKRVVFSGAAITLIASPGGRIKKLYVDEVGMLDVKDLRTLYKKGGIQSMQSQPGQATLWTATSVVDGAIPYKVEPSPLGRVSYFQTKQGGHYLSIPTLPLLDIAALEQKVASVSAFSVSASVFKQ